MKNKFSQNIVLKIASIVIAVVLWFTVQTSVRPQIEWTITREIKFNNSESLKNKNLARVGEENPITVKVIARGGLIDLILNDHSKCKVSCNLSEIDVAGIHELEVECTRTNGKVSYVLEESKTLSIETEEIITKEMEVGFITAGKVKDGFYTDMKYITPDPAVVLLKGRKSEVEKVSEIECEVKLGNRSESFEDRYRLILKDENGREIETLAETSPSSVDVKVQIFAEKTVDVEIAGLDQDVEYKPLSVNIAGKEEEIEKIDKLTVKDFRLSSKEKGHTQEVNLKLPEGVFVVDEKLPVLTVTGVKSGEDS